MLILPRPIRLLLNRGRDDPALIEITIADLMTSPAAAAAILVLCDSTILAANVITFTIEIICMTAGTEWRVL